jgi:hypothetical protein
MKELNEDRVNRFCLKKQHLTDDTRVNDIVKITGDIGGLHATSSTTTYLSLFIRAKKFKRRGLDQELYEKRNLGKIRYVRATIYILPKEMVPMAFSAVKSLIEPMAEKYSQYYGITKKDYKKISKQILENIEGKSLAAKEVRHALGSDMKISHVLNLMCDSGLLIRGRPKYGWKSTQHTYHRMDEYFPGLDVFETPEPEAKKSLVELYIKSFGPVTLTDMAWWTRFTKTEIKGILEDLEDKLVEVGVSYNDEPHFIIKSQEKSLKSIRMGKKPIVILLPILDPYIMGYKDRERYLDMDYYDYVFDRSGNGASTIMVDGKIIGIWDYADKPQPSVKIHLFKEVDKNVKNDIDSRAKKIGRFIADSKVQIKECKKMVPLPKRTAGAVMSPLKEC